VQTLREPTPAERSGFGVAVAAVNGRPLIGAERARSNGVRGAAYLFGCGSADGH